MTTTAISGWGLQPKVLSDLKIPLTYTDAKKQVLSCDSLITRGLGRSYADSSLSTVVLTSTGLDGFVDLDIKNGILTCQAGVSLREILSLIVPHGWFLPVTPGTSFVTLGGAIASDVHGKNHHLDGSFSSHVLNLKLLLGNGEILEISPTIYSDLFKATCAGMGLTGVILQATIKLKKINSTLIHQTLVKAGSIQEAYDAFEENKEVPYSVAWIDCSATGSKLGRSILMLGEHNKDLHLQKSGSLQLFDIPNQLNIPIHAPDFALNKWSIKAFNELYWKSQSTKQARNTVEMLPYFYPLDALQNWNRLYGKNGFFQYQFVIPFEAGIAPMKEILEKISNSGSGSFLAVLKQFGQGNDNFLSFPINGYTLALDFKYTLENMRLAKELDAIVLAYGGKLYLAKDALMDTYTFKKMYPLWEQFEKIRQDFHAAGKFNSLQSKRLGLL